MSGEAPLFPGVVHGIRSWRIRPERRLTGILRGRDHVWASGGRASRAGCLSAFHAAPHPGCACGLYAFHPFMELPPWASRTDLDTVTGVVEAWGRLELHRSGFRAGRARPVMLFEPAEHLVGTQRLHAVREAAARNGLPLAPLARPDYAGEWCRREGIGLSREVVHRLLSIPLALTLGPVAHLDEQRSRVTIGLWPDQLDGPPIGSNPAFPRPVQLNVPGVKTCRVMENRSDERPMDDSRFDPGRRLCLLGELRENARAEGIEVWDEHLELMAGHVPGELEIHFHHLVAGGLENAYALCRTEVLRGPEAGTRWLTVLIAPEVPIVIDRERHVPSLDARSVRL